MRWWKSSNNPIMHWAGEFKSDFPAIFWLRTTDSISYVYWQQRLNLQLGLLWRGLFPGLLEDDVTVHPGCRDSLRRRSGIVPRSEYQLLCFATCGLCL